MEMTEIHVSWNRFNILSDDFMWDRVYQSEETWLREEVREWVAEYREQGYVIELEEYEVPWLTPETVAMRLEGVTFKFADPTIATLFKLTWGGK